MGFKTQKILWKDIYWSFYLFALDFFVLLKNFWRIKRCHQYLWRASNFDLYSALMVIRQWRFFNVPHLLWHGTFVYNGHLQGPGNPHLLPSVCQWSFHCLFEWLTSKFVATGYQTLISRMQSKPFTYWATTVV